MTQKTIQYKVFWALLLSSEHSGVEEDSKSPTLQVLGFTLTLGQSGVATGAVHHLQGPLQPAEHDVPQFAQLYIIDSMDAQVTARVVALGATGVALHQPTLAGLQQMITTHLCNVQTSHGHAHTRLASMGSCH
jgi:hypothetical protein